MANAMVDTQFAESDQAYTLCCLLGEPLADALPIRLWCWGINTDRPDGCFKADAKRLADIVRFAGNCEQLLHAFLACEIIESTGKPDEYRIKGWDRNKRFFSERKRLGKLRKHAKSTRAKRVQDAKKTEHSFSSSFSSSSSKGVNTRARVIDTETKARPTKTLEPFLLAEFKTRCQEHDPPRPCPENWSDADARDAGRIIAAYPSRWQALIAKFVDDDFHGNVGFALSWLAKNAAQVEGRTPAPSGRQAGPGRVDVPSVEETQASIKAERDRIAAIPPEQLAENERKLAAIHAKLGVKP